MFFYLSFFRKVYRIKQYWTDIVIYGQWSVPYCAIFPLPYYVILPLIAIEDIPVSQSERRLRNIQSSTQNSMQNYYHAAVGHVSTVLFSTDRIRSFVILYKNKNKTKQNVSHDTILLCINLTKVINSLSKCNMEKQSPKSINECSFNSLMFPFVKKL